jgi:hypothetical protein
LRYELDPGAAKKGETAAKLEKGREVLIFGD